MKKPLLYTTIIISSLALGYLGYEIGKKINPPRYNQNSYQDDNNQNDNKEEKIPSPNTDNETPNTNIETITYNEKPAKENAEYFEKILKIQNQYAYIAYPIEIEKDNPPRLIVYSHGSNTFVSNDLKDPFMKDMQMYGEFFTNSGFAFAASNMHGANWGSIDALDDIDNMRNWIQKRYLLKDKINLFGFSMGGLPTFNYAFKYPNEIKSIALLAPTSRVYSKEQYENIKKIPIYIWHGDKDVNVPLSLSTSLLFRMKQYNLSNIKLQVVPNKGHFDIDTELNKHILLYFKENE